MAHPRIAALGVGLLGSALTASLLERGYVIAAHDPDPERMREHANRGGIVAGSVAEAVDGASIVLTSLMTGELVREVCLGEGGVASVAAAGTIVVDASTARPSDSIATGEALAAQGIGFLDAAVSGSSAMAWARDIVFMVGGSEADVARVRPVLEAMARSVHHVGPLGAGARTKLTVNLVLGAHRLALAEALVFGERSGLDPAALLDVLKDSAAYSRAMDVWGERMVTGDHDQPMSRIRQHAKDVALILEQGADIGAPMPVTSTLAEVLATAAEQGLAEADNSAVVEVLRRLAGGRG
jgi:3-hydroxyisobutyrate dehydrogenase-like beta-hydroxyacid dehydrogenase